MRSLRIVMFGRFEVWRAGSLVSESEWRRKAVKDVLKILVSKPDNLFTPEHLAELVLLEASPQMARRNIQSLVSRLRRVLEPELERGTESRFVIRVGQGYYFSPQADVWLDTSALLEAECRGDAAFDESAFSEAACHYEAAAKLYRGDFLEEDRYSEWTLDIREEWRERHAGILYKLARCYMQAGDYKRAVGIGRRGFEVRPWNEAAMQQLMMCYYASGERMEALRIFARGTEAMLQYLDATPSEETISLNLKIADQLPLEGLIAPPRSRLAVLPLVSIGHDPQVETAADGLTEQLIFALSQIESLRVIAQTSILTYKNSPKRANMIGRELGVGSLLEGSVRAIGDTIRITLQLIDASSEEHLWAATYDWPDAEVLQAQTTVAAAVAGALETEIKKADNERIERAVGGSSAGYAHYLKGRHFLGRLSDTNVRQAVDCFEASVAADPEFSLAHAALVEALCLRGLGGERTVEGLARAKEVANIAIRLDSELAEAQAAKALSCWLSKDEPDKAEEHFKRALELNPKCSMAHHWYGRFLLRTERRGDALVQFLRALEIDPLSPTLNALLAGTLGFEGRHEEAVYYCRKALTVEPSMTRARMSLASSLRALGDWTGAENELRSTIAEDPQNPFPEHVYASHLQYAGRMEEARIHQERSLELLRPPYREDMGYFYAGHFAFFDHDYELAICYLQKAIDTNPLLEQAHLWMSLCHSMRGEARDALASAAHSRGSSGRFLGYPTSMYELWITYAQALAHFVSADSAKVRAALKQVQGARPVPDRALVLALLFLALGDREQTLRWLDTSIRERDHMVVRIAALPMLDSLHDDPGFNALLSKLGLPDLPRELASPT